MTRKRDSAYFVARMRKESPLIYADLKAGRISSVRAASAKAGLIRLPTRLSVLQRAWRGASAKERHDFIAWVKKTRLGMPRMPSLKLPITDEEGYLRPDIVILLNKWLDKNHLKAVAILKEMKFSPYDATLSHALGSGRGRIRSELVKNLERWIARRGLLPT